MGINVLANVASLSHNKKFNARQQRLTRQVRRRASGLRLVDPFEDDSIEESGDAVREQIINQASIAILGQAHQLPKTALSLVA